MSHEHVREVEMLDPVINAHKNMFTRKRISDPQRHVGHSLGGEGLNCDVLNVEGAQGPWER